MKLILKKLTLSVLALLPFALLGLWFGWQYGMFPDFGLESGYYGQFNRVKHVIESMPNLAIVDHWQHQDITLEDFGFTLLVDGVREAQIRFVDGTPEKRERHRAKLRQIIQAQVGSFKAPDLEGPVAEGHVRRGEATDVDHLGH